MIDESVSICEITEKKTIMTTEGGKDDSQTSLDYSVENECPQEQLLVTLGLLILNPEPIKLSI